MLHEFQAYIRVDTELGSGYALFVETDKDDHWWTVILDNGAVVTFTQNKIRIHRSYSVGRNFSADEMRKVIALPEKRHK